MKTSKNFTVFTRNFWKENKDWPNGLEPHLGRKTILRRGLTEEEAQAVCKEWNANNNPGRLSRKAEYTNSL